MEVYKNSYTPSKGTLSKFSEPLNQWLLLNDRFLKAESDIVSCYTETSSLGHFNAALWSCPSGDWIALQEYQEEKRNNQKGRKKIQGRVDLYIKYKKKYKFVAEAKRVFINLKNVPPKNLIATLEDKVWYAWTDVKRNKEQYDADNLLAITFFDFQFPCQTKNDKREFRTRINDYVEIIENDQFDAGAYWLLSKPIIQDNWAYCGTFLVIEKYKI